MNKKKQKSNQHKFTFYMILCILLFHCFVFDCKQKVIVPEVPENGIQIVEVSDTNIILEWKPAFYNNKEVELYYKAVIVTELKILNNIALAASLTDKAKLLDWSKDIYKANADNLKPSTVYYLTVFVRAIEGQEVMYTPVKVLTRDKKNPVITIVGPEMILVQGQTMDFHGESVTVKDFYISKYELTYGEYYNLEKWGYENVLSTYYAKKFYPDFKNIPAGISWYDTLLCCNFLSLSTGLQPVYYEDKDLIQPLLRSYISNSIDFYINNKATGYRLPTEVEWEYAARGGNLSQGYIYSGSNNADEVAWYQSDPYQNNPVGRKKPNELGIYDMSGNKAEWCIDYWQDTPVSDSRLWLDVYYYQNSIYENARVIKGGFLFNPIYGELVPEMDYLRPDARMKLPLSIRGEDVSTAGLRVIRKK